MDFESILPEVGDFGRLQKLLFALLCFPICFTLSNTFMVQLFQTYQPDHWCKVPQLSELGDPEDRRRLGVPLQIRQEHLRYSQCSMYDLNYSQVLTAILSGNDTSMGLVQVLDSMGISTNVSQLPTRTCDSGYEYDFQNYTPTASSDWDWVCDDDWRPYVCLAVFFFGSSVGCLAFGFISDRYGRVPTVLLVNFVAAVTSVGTAFTTGFYSFAAARFFAGTTFDTTHIVFYILVVEYTAASKRTLVANLSLALFFGSGSTVLPWLAYYLPNWKMLSVVTGAQFAFILFFFRCIPESSRWLASQGRIKDAIKNLMWIAKFNGKVLRDDFAKSIQDKYTTDQKLEINQHSYTLIDVFKTRRLRNRVIIMTITWTCVMFCYDGLVRNTENLGQSVYFSSTIGNATEFPAAIIPILVIDRIGRKVTSILNFVLGALFCLSVIFIPADYSITYLVMATLGRMEVTVLMNCLIQYGTEMFPTVVRSQVMSLIHIVGFVGSMLSPVVVYMGHVNHRLPLIVFGVVCLAAAALTLTFPETMGEVLPDSLEDGENFGLGQPMIPLLSKAKRDVPQYMGPNISQNATLGQPSKF